MFLDGAEQEVWTKIPKYLEEGDSVKKGRDHVWAATDYGHEILQLHHRRQKWLMGYAVVPHKEIRTGVILHKQVVHLHGKVQTKVVDKKQYLENVKGFFVAKGNHLDQHGNQLKWLASDQFTFEMLSEQPKSIADYFKNNVLHNLY